MNQLQVQFTLTTSISDRTGWTILLTSAKPTPMASGAKTGQDARAERLAAQLRANLKRRKAQARSRDDLSGLDPNRTETPLNSPIAAAKDDDETEA